ncbi:uncharacterized protein B0P05DRAFT_635278 [Gilbertella persicaria]|uniref:uncharacterized protein n=1 Tax=Gilbertella persicaria TaxID=101096 RepID=UPI0022212580|nr:uncharacterized protein B0P05DRAFT_635278 [Gilbertella persicaria]KAI8088078.1 hypothetical protein B0P05DRAFT_635278 [Gilbertella persicaria]
MRALGDKCIHKACGTKNGTGYKGYCCLTDDDCLDSCINNQCNGIKNPKFADPISTKKNPKYADPIPDSCKKDNISYFGSNDKNGPAGVCCDSDQDCQNSCVNDHCTAKKNPKYADSIPASCKKDNIRYFGSNDKNGPAGVCCDSDQDCQNSCVNDHCTAKKNPKYADSIPASCKKQNIRYFGSNDKNGPAGVCCDSDQDCQHKCVKDHCTAH